ncbi:MAG: c-type cytochrome [Terriglobia bacterium]
MSGIIRITNRWPAYVLVAIAAGCLCGWSTLSRGQGKAASGPHSENQKDAAEHGRIQFQKTCAPCHGPEANGGSEGPDLMRSAVVRHDENGNLIGQVILNGFPNKGMPAFQFTSAQIADVAAFLHERVRESDGVSPEEPGSGYPAAELLNGNAAAGKAFFYGVGGCSSCHSPTGDLAGIARRYPAADLQAQFLYPDEPVSATVTVASGKRFTGEVKLLTPYDVAIVDKAGWYRSWPRTAVKVRLNDRLAAHRRLLFKLTDADMHNILAYLETLK